ncbi:hypothetical protein BDV98DRAFT_151858 [Pterulicium gracile]|uniref:Anti-proliferative protein domain-containing protein n=1 Tax=Pterulicium gracile TaxID=1884261 RepID=A0A5C3R1I8_9AGAR|nr:hypothetical protein BDV98DRAFT_151858 [Pterula gracilis]
MSSSSLAVTVSQAVAFLTRPLSGLRSPATINKLQLVLEANLVAAFAPTWEPTNPLSGSRRRCLTLSPYSVPPRPIHNACVAANVDWADWIPRISMQEFDLFVDPGCVSYRIAGSRAGEAPHFTTVWANQLPSPVAPLMNASRIRADLSNSKTLSQQLSEFDDEEDAEIFAMIDDVRAPQWLSPLNTRVSGANSRRSVSPISTISTHSRSSSSSSLSGYSYDSGRSFSSSPQQGHPSRRERARQARVLIDTTKKEVTPYDGGKTTVLTGGVMLGGGGASSASVDQSFSPSTRPSARNWRNVSA